MGRQSEIIIDALLPADGALPGGVESGCVDFLQRFRAEAPPAMVWALRAALFCAVWVAPLLIGALPPLSRLPAEDRQRALAAMAKSRSAVLRQLVLLLKATISFHYGAQEPVRRAIGFPQ